VYITSFCNSPHAESAVKVRQSRYAENECMNVYARNGSEEEGEGYMMIHEIVRWRLEKR
jgi:hypothetical protein